MRPRIHFYEGAPYPLQLERGDVVFVAGSPPSGRPLPWEHAALVAETCVVTCDEKLLTLKTFGLPESGVLNADGTPIAGLHARVIGSSYAANRCAQVEWINLSAPEQCWNLGGKPFGNDENAATFCMDQLDQRRGEITFLYQNNQHAFPPKLLDETLPTNCVGFVCWVLRLARLRLVEEDFGFAYPSPYTPDETRTYPSPGHLARALTGKVPLPYRPSDAAEASRYATAVKTLEEHLQELG